MSIELMKKLEDLEQTRSSYYKQLSAKIERKKLDSINEVVNDFSKFFNEKGFQVSSKTGLVEANYGKLRATLSYEDPSSNDYFGILFRFDIDLSALKKPNITVALNRSKPGLSVSSTYSYKSEEEKLKIDITRIEKEIEEAKLRLENFDNEQWSLFVRDDKQNYQISKPYPSMYELLIDLIK